MKQYQLKKNNSARLMRNLTHRTKESAEQTNQKRKRIAIKLLLIIFSVIVVLIASELGLRIYFFIHEERLLNFKPKRSTIHRSMDPYLGGFRFPPNTTGFYVPLSQEYQTFITSNSLGWRDTEHKFWNEEDNFRILFLGDSFVENLQVPLEMTFFKIAQQKLEQIFPDKKIETIAIGIASSGPTQQYLYYNLYGKTYEPNIVIQMFFMGNDITDSSQELSQNFYMRYLAFDEEKLIVLPYSVDKTIQYTVSLLLRNYTRIGELLMQVMDYITYYRNSTKIKNIRSQIYNPNKRSEIQAVWDITLKTLLRMKTEATLKKQQYIIFVIPSPEQLYGQALTAEGSLYLDDSQISLDFSLPDKQLKEFCNNEKISCHFLIDDYKKFIAENPTTFLYFPYDGHWTEAGSRLTGSIIANYLHENIK